MVRHVIIGSDSTLGNAIIRVLISIGNVEIVCCNPDGEIPNDVPSFDFKIYNVDIMNKLALEAVLQKDDIIYNTQVLRDENLLGVRLEIHKIGFQNLMEVANKVKALRVITFLPQSISWEIPINATEETKLTASTPYQKSLMETLRIARKYLNNEDYIEPQRIRKLLNKNKQRVNKDSESKNEKLDPSDKNEIQQETASTSVSSLTGPSLSGPTPTGPQSPSSGPSLSGPTVTGPQSPSSGPSLSGPTVTGPQSPSSGPSLSGPTVTGPQSPSSGPSLSGPNATGPQAPSSGPSLGGPQASTISINSKTENEKSKNLDIKLSEVEEKMVVEEKEPRVPLVIARIARFFGPFDETLTDNLCHAVRLQRLTLVGKLRCNISWINPIDAARAMTIMSDSKVEPGEYLINGFSATPLQIINELDSVNHSKTILTEERFAINLIKLKLKDILVKFGIVKKIDYSSVYSMNKNQVFDDIKAEKTWNWKPRFNLKKSAKDGMNWYINHYVRDQTLKD